MKTFLPQERKPNLRNKFMMFLFRASLLMSFCLFVTPELNAQSTVECGVGSCSANDMRLDYAYLGDSEKNPLSDDFECFEDDITTVYLYLVFKANTAASRYAMKVHYQIVIDGQVVDEIDECGGKGVPIEVGVPLLGNPVTWECGQKVEIKDFYLSWQSSPNSACNCESSKCFYQLEAFKVNAPLAVRFKEELECNTNTGFQGYYFTSTDVGFDVTGGIEPYSYSWDFGDDANPSSSSIADPGLVTYASTGEKTVTLEVTDAKGIIKSAEHFVNIYNVLSVSEDSHKDVTCDGDSDGNIFITANGGKSPYTYNWSTLNGSGIVQGQKESVSTFRWRLYCYSHRCEQLYCDSLCNDRCK